MCMDNFFVYLFENKVTALPPTVVMTTPTVGTTVQTAAGSPGVVWTAVVVVIASENRIKG